MAYVFDEGLRKKIAAKGEEEKSTSQERQLRATHTAKTQYPAVSSSASARIHTQSDTHTLKNCHTVAEAEEAVVAAQASVEEALERALERAHRKQQPARATIK